MYQRIANQTESLKGLWAAKMNLQGKSALATDEDVAVYERKLDKLENELERRKDVGRQFVAILERQEQLMDDDEAGRKKHQVIVSLVFWCLLAFILLLFLLIDIFTE